MPDQAPANMPETCPLCGAQRKQRVCKDCGLRDQAMGCEHFGTPLVQAEADTASELCDNCFAARRQAAEDARHAAHADQLHG